MPTVFLFVLPGAIVGAYFHSLRGRALTGALTCFVIVVIVPLLLVAAGLTGVFRRRHGRSLIASAGHFLGVRRH